MFMKLLLPIKNLVKNIFIHIERLSDPQKQKIVKI